MLKSKTSRIGSIGEDIACTFLQGKGFSIIERNFRRPWGEIDIIAEKQGIVRFVEVKALSVSLDDISRENSYWPEEQIHPAKLRKIVRTAELYMANRKDGREFQIDSVGVLMDQMTRKARCRLLEQIL